MRQTTTRRRVGATLTAHPGAVAAAASSLRDAITTDRPAALAPAALGRRAVAAQCLTDTATTTPVTADELPADLLDQIRRALAELAAYRHLAADQRTTL
jgi:hypothetical protein